MVLGYLPVLFGLCYWFCMWSLVMWLFCFICLFGCLYSAHHMTTGVAGSGGDPCCTPYSLLTAYSPGGAPIPPLPADTWRHLQQYSGIMRYYRSLNLLANPVANPPPPFNIQPKPLTITYRILIYLSTNTLTGPRVKVTENIAYITKDQLRKSPHPWKILLANFMRISWKLLRRMWLGID